MLKNIILFVVFFIFGCFHLYAEDEIEEIKIGTKHTIHSDILNEDREYWVHLPYNYNKGTKYNVLYVLDGDTSFNQTSIIVDNLTLHGKIPEFIVIAILNTDRARDLTPNNSTIDYQGNDTQTENTTGGAKNFFNFIKTELNPYIEKTYSTSGYKTLIGHSLGGLFTIYLYIDNPGFFNSYISIDPSLWWDNGIMNKSLREKILKNPDVSSSFYMSSANNKELGPDNMLPNQLEFMEILSNWPSDKTRAKREYFDNDDHGSVTFLSTYNGLSYIFDGYKLSYVEATENPEYLENHFVNISKKLGYEFKPTEAIINRLGYTYLFSKNDTENALKMFKMNVENNPLSAYARDSLGDAYKKNGNLEQAEENYKKAIQLDPDWPTPKRKLKELLEKTDK